jgi:hypothetical protein
MTEKLRKTLEIEVKKNLYLEKMEDISSQIDCLLNAKKITQAEYDSLLQTQKKQLKFILDLNLLPRYEFICHSLEKEFSQILVKVDPGEILAEEFEIIEREAMKLNLTRVKYIQENLYHNSQVTSTLSDHHKIPLNPVQLFLKHLNQIWQSKIIVSLKAIANKIN